MQDYIDRILRCVDCGGEFVFTAGEQSFFADKGLKNEPKRCKPCKKRKNERIANATTYVRPKIEVAVRCAACGADTTVPFRPTQGRPVYCRACFMRMREAAAQAHTPLN